ncbi:MAG: aldo/keto reductase, partial [Methanobrevibacter sp.]|nr:aldo/keto reductase [Methanobrevibacter sp.]
EEREMIPLCRADNIATTPYSSLASGRLSRLPGEESKRLKEDFYAKLKYQNSETQDLEIIKRVNELAGNYGVSMTEVSLAWLLTKVTSPIVGATKMHHVEGAVNSVDLKLTSDDVAYLEEPYVAHDLVGVMADNKASASDDDKVWQKHTKDKI